MQRLSFLKKNRLRKRRDFLRVQRNGFRTQGPLLALVAKKRLGPEGRIGLTVSKAVGKAHTRNQVKRRLRHIIREHPALFFPYDLVVLAHQKAAQASFEQLQLELLKLALLLTKKKCFVSCSQVKS